MKPNQKIIEVDQFFEDVVLVFRDCGTGAGGFQPGNTCGQEEGAGSGDDSGTDSGDDSDTESDAEDESTDDADDDAEEDTGDESADESEREFDPDDPDPENQLRGQTPDPPADQLERRTPFTTDDGREIEHYAAELQNNPDELVLNDGRDVQERLDYAAGKQENDGFERSYTAQNVMEFYTGDGYQYTSGNKSGEDLIDDPSGSFLEGAYTQETIDSMADENVSAYEQELDDAIESGELPDEIKDAIATEYDDPEVLANPSDDVIQEARDRLVEQRRDAEVESLREEAIRANDDAIWEATRILEQRTAESVLECCIEIVRGVRLSDTELKDYIQTGYFTHENANSWTVDPKIARGFGGNVVMLRMRQPRVGWVNKDDARSEKEIVRPPARQKIKRVTQTANGGWLVDLEEDEEYQGL
jgi:hypothetical protein